MVLEQSHGRTKNIFVVEDDDSIGEFVQQALSEEVPCEVSLFPNGILALEAVKKTWPDLLIINYNLPHMNGIEFYDRVHKDNAGKTIPALMISARLPYEKVGERQIVAIEKPFELDHLVQTVKTLLKL